MARDSDGSYDSSDDENNNFIIKPLRMVSNGIDTKLFDSEHNEIKIKFFNSADGDINIKSLDGKSQKGHSDILIKISEYFKSMYNFKNMNGSKNLSKIETSTDVTFEFDHQTISSVFNAIYNIYFRMEPAKIKGNHLDKLLLLDQLQLNISVKEYKNKIFSKIISKNSKKWISFVEIIYELSALKELIKAFYKEYLKEDSYLPDITAKDLISISNRPFLNELLTIYDKKNKQTFDNLKIKIKQMGSIKNHNNKQSNKSNNHYYVCSEK